MTQVDISDKYQVDTFCLTDHLQEWMTYSITLHVPFSSPACVHNGPYECGEWTREGSTWPQPPLRKHLQWYVPCYLAYISKQFLKLMALIWLGKQFHQVIWLTSITFYWKTYAQEVLWLPQTILAGDLHCMSYPSPSPCFLSASSLSTVKIKAKCQKKRQFKTLRI